MDIEPCMDIESKLTYESSIINEISYLNFQQRVNYPKHYKFCDECLPDMCISRRDLRTFTMHLKPTDRLLLMAINDDVDEPADEPRRCLRIKVRKLIIRYSGPYVAKHLPHSGLDLLYRGTLTVKSKPRMLSDMLDFHFHSHPFFLRYLIRLNVPDEEKEVCLYSHPILDNCAWFIGNVTEYLHRTDKHKITYKIVSTFDQERIYEIQMNGVLLGYAGNFDLMAYDASHPIAGCEEDNNYLEDAIIRYTDRETRNTDDGILFGGDAFNNNGNSLIGIQEYLKSCNNCMLANKNAAAAAP